MWRYLPLRGILAAWHLHVCMYVCMYLRTGSQLTCLPAYSGSPRHSQLLFLSQQSKIDFADIEKHNLGH